jgi:hypothetical protein
MEKLVIFFNDKFTRVHRFILVFTYFLLSWLAYYVDLISIGTFVYSCTLLLFFELILEIFVVLLLVKKK